MISCFKSVTLLLDLFRLMAKRLLFLKMIYLTLSESVVHLNHAFGISLLLCLISKLISTAIGYHIFITDVMANGTVKIYWFLTNLPDIIGILWPSRQLIAFTERLNTIIIILNYAPFLNLRYTISFRSLNSLIQSIKFQRKT